ncbi:MAG: hypothetical protein H6510_03460 [Acidobacteria bacterium]|nr:hypothetical protein [Acidobacteriota bacterium]MCB9396854.1 hypothetical protein [Acidobacteriota bacterium]
MKRKWLIPILGLGLIAVWYGWVYHRSQVLGRDQVPQVAEQWRLLPRDPADQAYEHLRAFCAPFESFPGGPVLLMSRPDLTDQLATYSIDEEGWSALENALTQSYDPRCWRYPGGRMMDNMPQLNGAVKLVNYLLAHYAIHHDKESLRRSIVLARFFYGAPDLLSQMVFVSLMSRILECQRMEGTLSTNAFLSLLDFDFEDAPWKRSLWAEFQNEAAFLNPKIFMKDAAWSQRMLTRLMGSYNWYLTQIDLYDQYDQLVKQVGLPLNEISFEMAAPKIDRSAPNAMGKILVYTTGVGRFKAIFEKRAWVKVQLDLLKAQAVLETNQIPLSGAKLKEALDQLGAKDPASGSAYVVDENGSIQYQGVEPTAKASDQNHLPFVADRTGQPFYRAIQVLCEHPDSLISETILEGQWSETLGIPTRLEFPTNEPLDMYLIAQDANCPIRFLLDSGPESLHISDLGNLTGTWPTGKKELSLKLYVTVLEQTQALEITCVAKP